MAATAPDETDNIVDVVNWAMPGEKHILGMKYCGPGTNLAKRLDKQGRPRPENKPVDKVEEIALRLIWPMPNQRICPAGQLPIGGCWMSSKPLNHRLVGTR